MSMLRHDIAGRALLENADALLRLPFYIDGRSFLAIFTEVIGITRISKSKILKFHIKIKKMELSD